MKLATIHNSSSTQRRSRARSLIQLGGLLEHAGTLEAFNIPLGIDLQSDESVKNNIAALFKALLTINDMVTSKELDLKALALQGLEAFKAKGLSESRPLDRKQQQEIQDYFANDNSRLSRARLSRAQSLSPHADDSRE